MGIGDKKEALDRGQIGKIHAKIHVLTSFLTSTSSQPWQIVEQGPQADTRSPTAPSPNTLRSDIFCNKEALTSISGDLPSRFQRMPSQQPF